MALIPSLAAIAFTPPPSASLVIKVPGESGDKVLFSRTGILAFLAGNILEGCKILAPK